MGAAFVLVFVAPPLVLALFAGMVFRRKWMIAGLGSVIVSAVVLMATSSHGFIAMAPFAGVVSAIVLLPAVIAAFLGAKFVSWLTKEA